MLEFWIHVPTLQQWAKDHVCRRLRLMDFTWAFQLMLAIGSVIIDRRLEVDPESESNGIFAHQFLHKEGRSDTGSSDRQSRSTTGVIAAEVPIRIGFIYNIPVAIFFPFIRRRLVTFGKAGEEEEEDPFITKYTFKEGRYVLKKKYRRKLNQEKKARRRKKDKRRRRRMRRRNKNKIGQQRPKTEYRQPAVERADDDVDDEASVIRNCRCTSSSDTASTISPEVGATKSEEEQRVNGGVGGILADDRDSGWTGDEGDDGESEKPATTSILPPNFAESASGDNPSGSAARSLSDNNDDAGEWWAYPTFEQQHEIQLAVLDVYFAHLQIESEACKRRLICELAAAPERFYPMSELFLRRLKPTGPSSSGRFNRFVAAARAGFNNAEDDGMRRDAVCRELMLGSADGSPTCPFGVGDVIDVDRLRILQQISSYVNVEILELE